MKNVLLFLPNGFEIYEASAMIDVFGWNFVDGDGTTRLFTFGIKKDVKSAFNLSVTTDLAIDEINVNEYEALIIPGGFGEYGYYEDVYNEKFIELIREFHRKNKIIASICVGSLPIGKCGILEGKKATTYNMKNGVRQDTLREFGAEVINEPIVIEENIISSLNPSTALDVAFKLLELLTSKEKTDYIKKMMGFEK